MAVHLYEATGVIPAGTWVDHVGELRYFGLCAWYSCFVNLRCATGLMLRRMLLLVRVGLVR